MKKALKILLFIDAFFIFAAALFNPIYAIFVVEIGGGIRTASGAWAAFTITMGVFMFFISKWEDHVKHKGKLLVASYALMSLGTIGLVLVKTPIHLFFVQAIFGLAEAFNMPVFDAMYSKYLDKRKLASEWGLWNSLGAILTGIGALVGGYFASKYGFNFLFLIMFLFSITGFILSLRFLFRAKSLTNLAKS